MRKAVVDLGSNSVLLLVAEKQDGGWQTVAEMSEVTAFGEGLKKTGNLQPESMRRTLDALQRAFSVAEKHDAETFAFGTMSLRLAQNVKEFQHMAEEQGTPVNVISGQKEAELGITSVLNDPKFADNERITIIDVGGQSTELATCVREDGEWEQELAKSFAVGTLSLRDGTLADEVLTSQHLVKAAAEIDTAIGLVYVPGKAGTAVALGATGTNLITIREKMTRWDAERVHGQYLDFEEISKFVGWSSKMTDEERAKIEGLETGREKTIHIGALILERCLQATHAEGCFVSVRGWRHAMLDLV